MKLSPTRLQPAKINSKSLIIVLLQTQDHENLTSQHEAGKQYQLHAGVNSKGKDYIIVT